MMTNTKYANYSPMFLQEGPHSTMVLYIPSVFISYNGEALDEKSVLLRSSSIISKAALDILHLIEPIDDGMSYINSQAMHDWFFVLHCFTP